MRYLPLVPLILLLTGAVVSPSGVHALENERKTGTRGERVYDLRDFTRIEVSGVYDISVEVGPDFSIRLSSREASLDRVHVRAANETLYLGHQKGRSWRSKKSVDAAISLPALYGIEASGVVDGEIRGIDTDLFRVEVSGVGDLMLKGTCGMLRARLSGVGDLDASDLKCAHVDVKVSGVGDARVHASESLDANVSGIGDLTCFGSPSRVKKNKTFFSSISVH